MPYIHKYSGGSSRRIKHSPHIMHSMLPSSQSETDDHGIMRPVHPPTSLPSMRQSLFDGRDEDEMRNVTGYADGVRVDSFVDPITYDEARPMQEEALQELQNAVGYMSNCQALFTEWLNDLGE